MSCLLICNQVLIFRIILRISISLEIPLQEGIIFKLLHKHWPIRKEMKCSSSELCSSSNYVQVVKLRTVIGLTARIFSEAFDLVSLKQLLLKSSNVGNNILKTGEHAKHSVWHAGYFHKALQLH